MECFLPLCKSHHKHPKSNLKFAIILRHSHISAKPLLLYTRRSPAHILLQFCCYCSDSPFLYVRGHVCACDFNRLALCRFSYNLIQSFTHLHHAIFIIGMHGNYLLLNPKLLKPNVPKCMQTAMCGFRTFERSLEYTHAPMRVVSVAVCMHAYKNWPQCDNSTQYFHWNLFL